MRTPDVLQSVRYLVGNNAEMRTLLGVANLNAALAVLVLKDGLYVNKTDFFGTPAIAFKFDEPEDDDMDYVPSNVVHLQATICNNIKNNDCMLTCIKIKDKLKVILANKCNTDRKHEDINIQGQSLGLAPKVRGIFWVSGLTYDDKEQGSERLHKINCLFKLIVGD